MAQMVKDPPAMQKTQEMGVQSLGWEEPLEEEVVTHSSNLAWRIPWIEEPGRLQSLGSQRVRQNLSNLATVTIHLKVFVWACGFVSFG